MDVMELRRRLLMQSAVPGEQWDYTILPISPNEQGRGAIPTTRVKLTLGQEITIKYTGIIDRTAGRIFIDGYYARTTMDGVSTNIINCGNLTSDDGTIVLKAGRTGYVSIGGSRNNAEGTSSSFWCNMIQVKVN